MCPGEFAPDTGLIAALVLNARAGINRFCLITAVVSGDAVLVEEGLAQSCFYEGVIVAVKRHDGDWSAVLRGIRDNAVFAGTGGDRSKHVEYEW